MNKKIRRLSIGLAALMCLQGFALSATGDDAQLEPHPTASWAADAPVSDPKQTEAPSERTNAPEPAASPDSSMPPSATGTPEETPSAAPETSELPVASQEPAGTPESSAEPTMEPTAELPAEPVPSAEPTMEPTPNPSVEPTAQPTAEATPTAEAEYSCGFSEHVHGAECYDEAQNLICEIPEHTHDESCLTAPETTPALPLEEEDQCAEDVSDQEELVVSPRVNDALWRGVKPSDERGMAIPMLFQGDYHHVVCTVGGIPRSVATSGCGATSLSMVIAYLTGNTEQNPYKLFCDSVDAGRYHGSGWSHETLSRFASEYGVHSRWISNDAEAILEALRQGKPVIAHMGPGIFTNRGHYLVLRGLTEDGLVLMNDPASRSNCAKAFPIDTLLKQAKNSESFMVCWSDEMPEPENCVPEGKTSETLWGDLNGSGCVDINDVQMLYALLESGAADASCDLNGDGAADQADLDALLEAVLNPSAIQSENSEGGDRV